MPCSARLTDALDPTQSGAGVERHSKPVAADRYLPCKLSYIRSYIVPQKKSQAIKIIAWLFIYVGAGEMNRTPDLLITNELLYRLSYTGNALDYSVLW